MSLHVSGTQIKDANNNTVILRGVFSAGLWVVPFPPGGNVNYTAEWGTLGAADSTSLKNLAAAGCNAFNFSQLAWGFFETSKPNGVPTAANFNSTILAWLDQLATWCQKYKMFFIIRTNNLSGYGSGAYFGGAGQTWPTFLNLASPPQVLGASGTYSSYSSGDTNAGDNFEAGFFDPTNATYNTARTEYGKMVWFLANRYANNPYVIIELFDEVGDFWAHTPDNTFSAHYATVISNLYKDIYGGNGYSGLNQSSGYNNFVIYCVPMHDYTGSASPTKPTITGGQGLVYEWHGYIADSNPVANESAWESWMNIALTRANGWGIPVCSLEGGALVTSGYADSTVSGWNTVTQSIINYFNNKGWVATGWYQMEDVKGDTWLGWGGGVPMATLYSIIFQGAKNPQGGGVPPPSLPFTEIFANLSAWAINDGTWQLISGGVQGSGSAEALMYAGNTAWTDYLITAPIKLVSGINNGDIVFRFQNPQNYYWAGLGDWGHQYSISKCVGGVYSEIIGTGAAASNPLGSTTNLQVVVQGSNIELYANGVLVLTATDTALASGAIGLRTYNSTIQVASVNVTTPITPTYFVNWTITPTSGNLPFTISFSGYLSRFSSTPDPGIIVNGETIQIQAQAPGSSTWVDTGIAATTGPGTSGNGYFSGTWQLTEPGIYPGAWQFKAYYAGNATKYLFGCDSKTRKKDLSRVNALIL